MALVITKDVPRVERISRNLGMLIGSIAFDSSYPTGGESLTDISKYFKTDLHVSFISDSGYVFMWNKTDDKVLAYITKDPGDAGGADVVLQEVGNTGDLSGLTAVRFIAVGLI